VTPLQIQAPSAYAIKHYGFVIYGLRSKLVFLFVKASVFVKASTLQNLSFSHKLRIHIVLLYRPLALLAKVTDSDKRSSLLQHGINCNRKKFYDTGPRTFDFV
jgi:hypothetical protein